MTSKVLEERIFQNHVGPGHPSTLGGEGGQDDTQVEKYYSIPSSARVCLIFRAPGTSSPWGRMP